jgi:ribosome biogenesis protein YTM1
MSYSSEIGICVSGHHDGKLRFWDPRTISIVKTITTAHDGWITSVNWHPKLQQLVSSSYDGTVKIWDFRSDVPFHCFKEMHNGKVLTTVWDSVAKDGSYIISGGADGRISRMLLPF